MAFLTDMQDLSSHNGLLRCFDDETKLLENIKKFLNQRIKCDRDYYAALSPIITAALKIEQPSFSSQIYQAWMGILKKMESFNELLRTATDKMCTQILERTLNLISEKRFMRRYFATERERIDYELEQLKEDVKSQEDEYEHILQKSQQDYQKYCDTKSRGVAKSEETRSRYIKSASKLHKVHNEYLTTLQEVNIQQDNYATSFLPNLLNHEQLTLESQASLIKSLLTDFCELCDTSTESYRMVFFDMKSSAASIEPESAYVNLVEKYRSAPLEKQKFFFRPNMLSNYKGRLRANELTFDTLSAEALGQRIELVENRRMEFQQTASSKQEDMHSLENRLSTNCDTAYQLYLNEKDMRELNNQIIEAKMTEQKYIKLIEYLQKAVGHNIDQTIPYGVEAEKDVHPGQEDNSPSTTNFKKRFLNFFKKSSKQSVTEMESNSDNHIIPYNSESSPEKATKPAPPVVPRKPSNAVNSVPNRYEDVSFSIPANDRLQYKTSSVTNRPLEQESWYHGALPREEVTRLLANDGDFLVRESRDRKTNEVKLVLSVKWATADKHFIFNKQDNGWKLENQTFPSIQDLIHHHLTTGEPVTKKTGAILVQQVTHDSWELNNDDIELGPKLGSGHFGDVYKGTLKMGYTKMEVAVKSCRDTISDDQKSKFLQEGHTMRNYSHPNIVRFIGIASNKSPVYIVMEYLPGGALNSYLKKQGIYLDTQTLVRMAHDVACGMAYLAEHNCIHRDLAARNCLLGKENIVKISDFGLSREVEDDVYTMSSGAKQIPVKWTSPEALNLHTYSSASDVWSYGVLLWEIFMFGQNPYPNMTNKVVQMKIEQGYRMSVPERMPDKVGFVMQHCWQHSPANRPTFNTICEDLQDYLNSL